MHHITIRDQVCNVMASLTKTFLSVPRLSCKTLKRSLLADYHSCCMPFSMVGSTGTVLQNDESAPCKRAVPARSKSGSPPRSRSAGSSGSYVVRIASRNWSFSHANVWKLALCPHRIDEELSLVKARQWIS